MLMFGAAACSVETKHRGRPLDLVLHCWTALARRIELLIRLLNGKCRLRGSEPRKKVVPLEKAVFAKKRSFSCEKSWFTFYTATKIVCKSCKV